MAKRLIFDNDAKVVFFSFAQSAEAIVENRAVQARHMEDVKRVRFNWGMCWHVLGLDQTFWMCVVGTFDNRKNNMLVVLYPPSIFIVTRNVCVGGVEKRWRFLFRRCIMSDRRISFCSYSTVTNHHLFLILLNHEKTWWQYGGIRIFGIENVKRMVQFSQQ